MGHVVLNSYFIYCFYLLFPWRSLHGVKHGEDFVLKTVTLLNIFITNRGENIIAYMCVLLFATYTEFFFFSTPSAQL